MYVCKSVRTLLLLLPPSINTHTDQLNTKCNTRALQERVFAEQQAVLGADPLAKPLDFDDIGKMVRGR